MGFLSTAAMLLGRKAMTKLDRILKSRDITFPMKLHTVKAMVFPVVMYECESWTIKKIEHQRTDASNWNWKRLLRVPWTAKRCLLFLVCVVCHSFSFQEQASFNFMAAITVCGDFGAQENEICHCFHFFPICLP